MILTNYYGYRRVNDFSAEGSVFDHKGAIVQQKTDLPIIVINWLNGQMIARETDSLPVEELNKIHAQVAEAQKKAEDTDQTDELIFNEEEAVPVKKPVIIKKKAKKKAKKKKGK
jgi:hypothetical protein